MSETVSHKIVGRCASTYSCRLPPTGILFWVRVSFADIWLIFSQVLRWYSQIELTVVLHEILHSHIVLFLHVLQITTHSCSTKSRLRILMKVLRALWRGYLLALRLKIRLLPIGDFWKLFLIMSRGWIVSCWSLLLYSVSSMIVWSAILTKDLVVLVVGV